MRYLLLMAIPLIAGCSGVDKAIAYVPQRVEVPIISTCPKPEISRPINPLVLLPKDAALDEVLKQSLSYNLKLSSYTDKLEVALEACQ